MQNQIAVKALALLTMLMMVFSLLPSSVFAQSEGETPVEQQVPDSVPTNDEIVGGDEEGISGDENVESFSRQPKPPKEEEDDNDESKVTICHATESETNPYTQNEVSKWSILKPINGHNGHDDDIIPPFERILFPNYTGKNWDDEGQAIWNNDCAIPEPEIPAVPVCDLGSETVADTTFDTFSLGNVNGQNGWSSTGSFDQEVVTNTYGYTTFGCKSLRISNAVTSSSFGDQTFAASLTNSVGETIATNGVFPVGTRFNRYEAQFDIASTKQTQQSGLRMTVSPDRGDGSRMSFLAFQDTASGIDIVFNEVLGTGPVSFVPTTIATINRNPHTIKLVVNTNEGASNDVVEVYVDGVLKHTGTSWENYYRFDAEASAEQTPRLIKTLLFRSSNTAAPATDGEGFLFDNMSLKALNQPKAKEVTVVATKIVCTDEAELPNFGASGPAMTATTASDWVTAHKSCSFAKDWQFQYADQTGIDTAGNFTGTAAGYTTFTNSTDVNGVTTQVIPLGKGVSELHLREVLQAGYIPFSKDGANNVSAEFYCADDVLNYDNWDFIRNPESGETYYCVAWNVKKPQETVKVHIYKYLQVGTTSAQVPNDSTAPSFPMISSWSATNIGTGSGSYVLGNNEGGTVLEYAADTSAMSVPADYTTSEVTGGDSVVLPADVKCILGKYRLVGYKQGDSIGAAESATLTATAPVYTDITTDKYVIVVNEKCGDNPKPVCEIGQNLMLNGSFENTPAVTANGGQWQIFAGGILNWLATLSSGLEVWNTFNGTGNDVASDGLQNVELDGDDATNIAQDVATIPGATYELKFDYSARAATALADSKMDAMINGVSALTVNTDGSAATQNMWEPKTVSFVATGTSTKISFEDKGAANLDGGFGPLLDNVSLCLTKEPVPEPVCTLTIKSDVMDYVVEKNAMAQALSTINGAWVTAFGTSTAAWIWGDNPVVNPTVAETQTFKKGFNWTGGAVTSATLKLSSDNTHKVTLGAFGVTDSGEFNYGPADISTYNVATGITAGANMLEIAVGNIPMPGSTAAENPAGLMYELTITGTGKSCGTVVPEVPKTTGTVTMCKVDEDKNPLSGWTLTLLGNEVEKVIVPATNAGGANTVATLSGGKSYVAKASGTWKNDRSPYPINMVDAEYSTENTWTSHMDGFGSDTEILELSINNVLNGLPSWGAYNSDHSYAQMFTQATGTANFRIADSYYGDNSGSLKVAVYEGYAGITGKNGCVTFTDVPFGTYGAGEIVQNGWSYVSGAGSTVVNHLNTPKTITIVNEEDEDEDGDNDDTYILDGYKFECFLDGEVYCDDDGLAGWKIKAVNGSTTLSTTTNASGYYSFEVGEGDWTVSEVMKPDWEQVDIDVYGGEVDGETCVFEVDEDTIWEQAVKFVKKSKYSNYQCNFGNYEDEDGDNEPRTYTVTGFKWNDVDGDGEKDAEEGKLANWLITATQGTTSVATTTNASGNYTLILPYDEGTWVVSETLQGGWAQTGRYQNGTKVTLGGEVSNNCSFNLGIIAPTATCDFGNKQNTVVIADPETPTPTNRGGNGGSSTRVKKDAPVGLVLGAATGTPACGMYLQDYMRMGNAASSTQVTKLQVFLNAVGITAPLTGVFDAATDAAVRAFQMQYKPEVLTPWYLAKLVPHENSTGWVYQLTRWKINNIVCPGSEAYPVLN